MKKPKISIVVPVYNIKQYLASCIESLLSQTFRDFELLLINDGSTDSSGSICDYFASLDKRIIVYHLRNRGVSFARNIGIQKSIGDWITFVDGDDAVNEHYLEYLYDNNFDLTVGGAIIFNVVNSKRISFKQSEISNDLSGLAYLSQSEVFRTCWGKLFRKEIIINKQIFFNENTRLGEDTLFILDYIKYCKNIKISQYSNYFYREQNFVSDKYKLKLSDYIKIYLLQLEKTQELMKVKDINLSVFNETNKKNFGFDLLKNIYLSKEHYCIKERKFYLEDFEDKAKLKFSKCFSNKFGFIFLIKDFTQIFILLDLFYKIYFQLLSLKHKIRC